MSLFFFKWSEEPLMKNFPTLSPHSFTRTAGPPAEMPLMLLWVFIGLAAFGSLLYMPQLALRQGQTKEQKELQRVQDQIAGAQNDIRACAYHFWGCCALIFSYDMVLRLLSLLLLSPRQLFVQQFFPLVTVNQTFFCNHIDTLNMVRVPIGTGRIPLCSEVPRWWEASSADHQQQNIPASSFVPGTGLAAAGGGDATAAAATAFTTLKKAATAIGINDLAAPFNAATAQGTTLIVSQLTLAVLAAVIVFLVLAYRQWHNHTREYLLNQLPEQLPLPAAHSYVPRRPPNIFSTFFFMAVWLLVLLSAFGYKRAMPLVMRMVFPALICFSGAFSLLVK